ncbi:hypothetical protein V7S43_014956 [Phytophthora oleae]|uniref:Uncharacterized protein n=1 Tax=Phytophthora oleae TaxID=2107226 RepID=A0ABD3EZP1_9STRA
MSLHAERGPSSTKRDADLTGGDSSILRYIKTLTSHQTNAKQQRMDRYMQKVKYGRTNDLVKNVKPTGYNHQYELKPYMLKDNVPVPQFSKGKPPTQNVNLDNSKSTAQSELRVQGGETKPRKRLKSKRPYEGNQFKNSKRKKTKRKKQVVAVDSFDRFRFNRTRSPGRSQKSLSKTPQQSAASKLPGSTREALFNLQEPEFTGVTSIQVCLGCIA